MEIIVDHKRTKVFFNKKNNSYIKEFSPKWNFRFKYFLRLRRYPGKNFEYIAKQLNTLGIKTPKIIEAHKYKIITEKVEGILLRDYLKDNSDITKEFLDTIALILKNNIYFGDFNTGNFIVSEGNIYAIDLEDYRKVLFFKRTNKEAIKRLKKTLNNDLWVKYIEKQLVSESHITDKDTVICLN